MKALLSIVLLALPAYLFAQEDTDGISTRKPLSNHAIGGSASMVSSPGISYEYIFGDQRIKITGFAYMETAEYSNEENFTGIIGGEFQQDLQKSRSLRFFGFVGGYYWYENSVNEYTTVTKDPTYLQLTKRSNTMNEFAGGIGIGFEVEAWRHIYVSLDINILYRHTSWEYTSNYDDGSTEVNRDRTPQKYLGPGTGFAIYYRF